jgi:hypothetical protein
VKDARTDCFANDLRGAKARVHLLWAGGPSGSLGVGLHIASGQVLMVDIPPGVTGISLSPTELANLATSLTLC